MVTKKCPNIDQNINFELKSCWKSDFTTKLMIIHKYMNQR